MINDIRLPPDVGEKLHACLIYAINYQTEHKGRARLTRDKPQRFLSPDRIASDVKSAMRLLDLPSEPIVDIHPMLRHLRHVLDRVKARDIAVHEIEDWVWGFTGLSEEDRHLDTPDDYIDLAWHLTILIEQEQRSLGAELTSPRGRQADEVLRALIGQLANIYHAYTGFKATASEDKEGAGLKSPFFDFVNLIFRYYKDRPQVELWRSSSGTVNNAIKYKTSSVGGAEFIADHELIDFDVFFPAVN